MLKVLLVDDEELSVRMLENLIDWNQYGIQVIGTARNGKDALGLFLRHQPEMIVSDIRMPEMDGLELMRKVKEIDPTVEFILVSAYADFEYAQQAIALGSANYLLKPVDEYELEKTLKKITDRIDRQKSAQRLVQTAQTQKSSMAIYTYMRSGNGLGAAQKSGARLGISFGEYALMGFMLNESSMNAYIQNSLQIDAQLAYLHHKLAQKLGEWCDSLLFDYYDSCWCALVYEAHGSLQRYAVDMARFFEEELHMEVHVCFTESTQGLENLPMAYRKLHQLNQYSFFIGEENVLGYGYNCDTEGFDQVELADARKSLCAAIEKGDGEQARCVVEETLRDVQQRSPATLPYIRDFCYAGVRALREKMTEDTPVEKREQLKKITYQDIEDCTTLDELREFTLRTIALIEPVDTRQQEYSPLVQDGLAYLKKNFDHNISLEEICGVLGVSRNYFCYLFKKETGQNLWAYLTEIRLNKAKELLRSTQDKTYAIAYQVGYDNPSYFSKLFKKSTGMSPNEYRKTE